MRKHLTLLIVLITQFSCAQAYSHADSVKALSYWDSANNCELYSQKRQLYLDSALSILPGYAWWWQQKSMPLYKQHKYQVGRPFIDSAVKYDPEKWLDYRAFLDCIFQKDYLTAIKGFTAARKLHGNSGVMDHSYDFYIGLSYLQLNKFDSAGHYINISIDRVRKKLGDDWVNTTELFYAGIVQYELQNYDSAIAWLDKALRIYKNFSDAKYYKVCCLLEKHQPQNTLALAKEASNDFKQGYSIVEDNVVYETYPYQITPRYHLDNLVKYLEAMK